MIGKQRRFDDRLLAHALANGRAEDKGLLTHQRRIRERRDIREADARLGGPADWDAPERAARAEAEVENREAAAWMAEKRAHAGPRSILAPAREHGPRCTAL